MSVHFTMIWHPELRKCLLVNNLCHFVLRQMSKNFLEKCDRKDSVSLTYLDLQKDVFSEG